jgi:hypothetical protein
VNREELSVKRERQTKISNYCNELVAVIELSNLSSLINSQYNFKVEIDQLIHFGKSILIYFSTRGTNESVVKMNHRQN